MRSWRLLKPSWNSVGKEALPAEEGPPCEESMVPVQATSAQDGSRSAALNDLQAAVTLAESDNDPGTAAEAKRLMK